MGRPPEHHSGAKIHFAIRLPPAHLQGLDEWAKTKGFTRSQAIGHLIEQAGLIEDVPEPSDDVNVVETMTSDRVTVSPLGAPSLGEPCPHPMSKSVAKTGASSNIRRCGLCGHIGGPNTFEIDQ